MPLIRFSQMVAEADLGKKMPPKKGKKPAPDQEQDGPPMADKGAPDQQPGQDQQQPQGKLPLKAKKPLPGQQDEVDPNKEADPNAPQPAGEINPKDAENLKKVLHDPEKPKKDGAQDSSEFDGPEKVTVLVTNPREGDDTLRMKDDQQGQKAPVQVSGPAGQSGGDDQAKDKPPVDPKAKKKPDPKMKTESLWLRFTKRV